MNKTLILALAIAFASFGCADEEGAVSTTPETVISSETDEAVILSEAGDPVSSEVVVDEATTSAEAIVDEATTSAETAVSNAVDDAVVASEAIVYSAEEKVVN